MPDHDSPLRFFRKSIGPQPIYLLHKNGMLMHDKFHDHQHHDCDLLSGAVLFMLVTPIPLTTRH